MSEERLAPGDLHTEVKESEGAGVGGIPEGDGGNGENRQPRRRGSIAKGLGLLALLHLLPILFPLLYFGIGVVQIVYVIPAVFCFRKETRTMQGILIGSGITFLLNAACFGIVMQS